MICCPMCDRPVLADQEEGILINQVARQGALVVELRERAAKARVPGLFAEQIVEARQKLDLLRAQLAIVMTYRKEGR